MRDVLLRLGLPRASLPQYAGDGVPGACAGLSFDGGVLVDVLVSAQQEEPPEHVLGSPPPDEPRSKWFLTLRRRRRWKTYLPLFRR